jgi:hypothetical protein
MINKVLLDPQPIGATFWYQEDSHWLFYKIDSDGHLLQFWSINPPDSSCNWNPSRAKDVWEWIQQ